MLQVILLCTAAASWISIVYKIDHRTSSSDFDVLYDKPWVRISPYLVGLAGGVAAWALKTRWRNRDGWIFFLEIPIFPQ